jgi:hypothetical protein
MKLPDTVTPEQFAKIAPSIIRYLLATQQGFTDSIDEILEWSIDGDTISGQFLDRRPGKDRIFGFSLTIDGDQIDREYWPISGVD